jgi:hypothetical protein
VGDYFRNFQLVPTVDTDAACLWFQYYPDWINRLYRIFSYSAIAGRRRILTEGFRCRVSGVSPTTGYKTADVDDHATQLFTAEFAENAEKEKYKYSRRSPLAMKYI